MAKLSMEQALAVNEVQQLINDWAYELDENQGLEIANLLTEDCIYSVRGAPVKGSAAIVQFYKGRFETLSSQGAGVPTQRHTISNLRVGFRSADEVSITFTLLFFTTAGSGNGLSQTAPAAVADVRMDCQRGSDGEWRIAKFDSNQTFRREHYVKTPTDR